MNLMKRSVLSMAGFICIMNLSAQQTAEPILMSFGKEKVSLSEFENIFRKNNSKDQKIDKKSLDEYIDLFINFKLKVHEAKENGLDTTVAFKNEFNGYKKQLSTPYLKDKKAEEAMLKEAYDRSKTELRVSHILLKSKSDCLSPEDSAALYKRAMDVIKRLQKENFEDVAKSVSEDDFSKTLGGDLGWFTSMMWAYPFETAAYNLKVGSISNPVRTSYGYHIIKVNESRPSRGEVKAAHIFVSANETDTAAVRKGKIKIQEAYSQLKGGKPWQEVVNSFSDDKASASSGGELPRFGIGKMVNTFEDKTFELQKKDDYTAPFKTKYGWHIVKLIEKFPLKPYEEQKEEFFKALQKNPRYKTLSENFAEASKKEYHYSENPLVIAEVKKLEDPTSKNIKYADLEKLKDDVVFTLGGNKYMFSELRDYIKSRMPKNGELTFCNFNEKYLTPFAHSKATAVAEENLDKKYPEYKALLAEYRDGILLFDLMDKKVWTKSIEDTAGLHAYYEKNKTNYMWKERADVVKFIAADDATAQKAIASGPKLLSGKLTPDALVANMNKKKTVLTSVSEMFEKGDNAIVDSLGWSSKVSPIMHSKENTYFYFIKGTRAPEVKALKDAKGLVISDYQAYLEQEWIKELRKKYPVQLDKSVLYSLINK